LKLKPSPNNALSEVERFVVDAAVYAFDDFEFVCWILLVETLKEKRKRRRGKRVKRMWP
jgi:hypothetical protein